MGWDETYFGTAAAYWHVACSVSCAWNKGDTDGVRFFKDVIGSGAMPRRPHGKDAKMLHDVTKLRRATARAIRSQPGLAALPRTMGVLLTAWLVYFFTINLFAKQLDTIKVPFVEVPLVGLSGRARRLWRVRRRGVPAHARGPRAIGEAGAFAPGAQPRCMVIVGRLSSAADEGKHDLAPMRIGAVLGHVDRLPRPERELAFDHRHVERDSRSAWSVHGPACRRGLRGDAPTAYPQARASAAPSADRSARRDRHSPGSPATPRCGG